MKVWIVFAQVACVASLTAVVGIPRVRPVGRAVIVWRTNGPLVPRPDLVESDRRILYGPAVAGLPGTPATDSEAATRVQGRGTVGAATLASTGVGRSMIRGRARTTLNRPAPFARMVLRNRLTGQVEATVTADAQGEFVFGNLASGIYVVELIGTDGAVIAATEMTAVAGGVALATLRIATNGTPRALFGTMGATTESNGTVFFGATASEPIGRAAAAGTGQATEPDEDVTPRS
jgi:hypothetical protein